MLGIFYRRADWLLFVGLLGIFLVVFEARSAVQRCVDGIVLSYTGKRQIRSQPLERHIATFSIQSIDNSNAELPTAIWFS
jgi:hypothetical protein